MDSLTGSNVLIPVTNDEGGTLYWYDRYSGIEYLFNNADDVYYPKSGGENAGYVIQPGWQPNEYDSYGRLIYGSNGIKLATNNTDTEFFYTSNNWPGGFKQFGNPVHIYEANYLAQDMKDFIYNSVMSQYDATYGYYINEAQLTSIAQYLPRISGSLKDFIYSVGFFALAVGGMYTAIPLGSVQNNATGLFDILTQNNYWLDLSHAVAPNDQSLNRVSGLVGLANLV